MEESPHKCPVCSRSFNQRSNLKTHLLTHTDHKPYECSSCRKVFRRNCDLRRHALTHNLTGDVPSENVEDQGEEKNSDEDDETVLEVDSPAQSPGRNSPSSVDMLTQRKTGHNADDNDHGDGDDECRGDDDETSSGVTHCHHEVENGSVISYTMRPLSEQREQRSVSSLHDQSYQPDSAEQTQPVPPMLHVRRDLHQRAVRASSTMLESSYINSIPIRKRPIGLDGEPYPRNIIAAHYHGLLKQSVRPFQNQQSARTTLEHVQHVQEISNQCKIGSVATDEHTELGPKPSVSHLIDQNLDKSVPIPGGSTVSIQTQMQNVPKPPIKKTGRTGFSIEDIMRR